MCFLVNPVPVFHVLCHVTLCPSSWGAHVAWIRGPVAMARSQPGAFHPAPAYHSCLRASAWLHRIPGAACPPLLPPLALTGPRALPPPGTGWHPPLSGPPCQGRINRILLQCRAPASVPMWAHMWVGRGGCASARGQLTPHPRTLQPRDRERPVSTRARAAGATVLVP